MRKEELKRKKVREGYAEIVKNKSSCCSCTPSSEMSRKMGYIEEELQSVPKEANMGLGCGNPIALASLKEGETVIDLGSGGGFDCFLAARRVGEKGRVIGVDMTPEMIDAARKNAQKAKFKNVEFRLGEIENLPVADNTADVVISNCVINLVPDKKRAFEEAFRVLKPEGRLMVSDIVLLKELPEAIRKRAPSTSCISSAMMKDKYIDTIRQAGFKDVRIINEASYSLEDIANDPEAKIIVANPTKNTEEQRKISELDEKTKKKLKESLGIIESVSVSAVKP